MVNRLLSCSLLVSILILFGFSGIRAQERLNVFASFENEAEISSVKASAGVQVSSSAKFPTWRNKSLEVVFPEKGGEIEIGCIPVDWRWQGALLVFVWSMQPAELDLVLADSA